MLSQLLIVIILYLIINQMILAFSSDKNNQENNNNNHNTDNDNNNNNNNNKDDSEKDFSGVKQVIPIDLFGKPYQYEPNKFIIWSFSQPNPWTQIIYNNNDAFPFKFYLKVRIPTLNDYQAWKQLIPNLEFES